MIVKKVFAKVLMQEKFLQYIFCRKVAILPSYKVYTGTSFSRVDTTYLISTWQAHPTDVEPSCNL